MKPGDLRRFKDNDTTRAYDGPGYVQIAGMPFMVTEVDSDPVPAWVSFIAGSEHHQHWVHDFVLGHSEALDETR